MTFLFCWVPGFKALGPWEALEDDTSENDTMNPRFLSSPFIIRVPLFPNTQF